MQTYSIAYTGSNFCITSKGIPSASFETARKGLESYVQGNNGIRAPFSAPNDGKHAFHDQYFVQGNLIVMRGTQDTQAPPGQGTLEFIMWGYDPAWGGTLGGKEFSGNREFRMVSGLNLPDILK